MKPVKITIEVANDEFGQSQIRTDVRSGEEHYAIREYMPESVFESYYDHAMDRAVYEFKRYFQEKIDKKLEIRRLKEKIDKLNED